MRLRIISWSLVILVIVTPIVFGLSACKTSSGNIASVQRMYVGISLQYYVSLGVDLKPTNLAQPNTDYIVYLYEKNQLRATTTVNWNQAEINVLDVKTVEFPISESEYEAYLDKDVSQIFSVKVSEQGASLISHSWTPTPTPQPTPSPVPLIPTITNVSNISAAQTQTIIVQGQGFGHYPSNGYSSVVLPK